MGFDLIVLVADGPFGAASVHATTFFGTDITGKVMTSSFPVIPE